MTQMMWVSALSAAKILGVTEEEIYRRVNAEEIHYTVDNLDVLIAFEPLLDEKIKAAGGEIER